MGFFDLIGTTLSGWLTDRFDPRKLLFVYYGLRGLSLVALPSMLGFAPRPGLLLFNDLLRARLGGDGAADHGARESPGSSAARRRTPILFGWVFNRPPARRTRRPRSAAG